MATIHQIEANRLNSQKSTGPRSATGKATSSRNALKSGIDAKSLVIDGEKPADLQALTDEYLDRFQPATPEQRVFVDILIRGDWQLRRLARVDAQIWEYEMSTAYELDEDSPLGHGFERAQRPFERLQRRINATERSYKSALRELQQLQSARDTQPDAQPVPAPSPQPQETKPPSSQIGFVPTPPPQPAPDPLARAQAPIPGLQLPSATVAVSRPEAARSTSPIAFSRAND